MIYVIILVMSLPYSYLSYSHMGLYLVTEYFTSINFLS